MVKERPEEARNSPKGNFYSFLSLLWGSFGGLWLSFILLFVLSCFIKVSNNDIIIILYQFVLKGQRE
ncbi:hypothetical protein [Helicobacter pylori]|uniref:hypothetical protein n=1 Tax=Helicobacter pylori TaxID=210 RepID=UPI001E5D66A0|nr:hypothetical protein [Helicobacter pylori]